MRDDVREDVHGDMREDVREDVDMLVSQLPDSWTGDGRVSGFDVRASRSIPPGTP
ncbi:hypothetical protein [Streptomyces sp. NPDC055036]